jgi:hypothetical protein
MQAYEEKMGRDAVSERYSDLLRSLLGGKRHKPGVIHVWARLYRPERLSEQASDLLAIIISDS